MPESGQVLQALKRRARDSLFVERVNNSGEIVVPQVQRGITRFSQGLVERGITPPWASSREQCQAYWASRATGDNAPSTYAGKDVKIVDFLNHFWAPEVQPSDSVLEIGCNAGTNLNRLLELGFSTLAGIEINANAVVELARAYPELAATANIRTATIEEGLRDIADGSVDVVFSMAVLIHVHPTSLDVFDEIVRVARRFVCVVEIEYASNNYVFPRNYDRVFSAGGCTELRSAMITRSGYPDVSRDYDGYIARLFKVPG